MQTTLIILLFLLTISLIVSLYLLFQKSKKSSSIEYNYEENINELKFTIDRVGEKNHDFESSVQYAKKIVDTLFKIGERVQFKGLEYFLFYKPKDIISGDFVWHHSTYDRHYFVVADCTGHGVPGAFMSIVSHNLLSQAVKVYGYSKPSDILEYVNKKHYEIFNKDSEARIKDGMDLAIVIVDMDAEIIEFGGAKRPLYILRKDGEIEKISGDRMSIGLDEYYSDENFTNHIIDFSSGDSIYMTSDGYIDQFGGEKGKKFKISRFNNLLKSFCNKKTIQQMKLVESTFDEWRGNQEQTDDVTILGIKFLEE